ncbi:MAG: hypothetical protein WCF36_05090 [Candidatus Nanopelagicales bacterium]
MELITGFRVEQPPEWLAGTPFSSYVVPGIALTGVVGGSALAALALALRDDPRWPMATCAAGTVLVGWITGEVVILAQPDTPSPIEVAYLGLGAAVVGLGWIARRRDRRAKTVG